MAILSTGLACALFAPVLLPIALLILMVLVGHTGKNNKQDAARENDEPNEAEESAEPAPSILLQTELLDDACEETQFQAIRTLEKCGSRAMTALPALEKLRTQHRSERIRHAATRAIQAIESAPSQNTQQASQSLLDSFRIPNA